MQMCSDATVGARVGVDPGNALTGLDSGSDADFSDDVPVLNAPTPL
jgi:hypothetical protein